MLYKYFNHSNMKSTPKLQLLFLALIFTSAVNAKVSFKLLKEHGAVPTAEKCGDFCLGSCTADGNVTNIDWNLGLEIAPNAAQEEKSQIIANYQTCLGMGLPYVKSHYEDLKTFTIMIPRGLFLIDEDGTYDEKMRFSDEKNENKLNFKAFVEMAQPIFDKEFESLKVLVWQKNPPKKK